jgi:fermentation-respiration switch protein FrsA (DUF1100 family)
MISDEMTFISKQLLRSSNSSPWPNQTPIPKFVTVPDGHSIKSNDRILYLLKVVGSDRSVPF